MSEKVEIDKDKLLKVLWGICLSDHMGDVLGSIDPLLEPLGIDETWGDEEDLMERMKSMDLVPEHLRD